MLLLIPFPSLSMGTNGVLEEEEMDFVSFFGPLL